MMPPPHLYNNNINRNRVENIKKKFEDINKCVPVADNLNTSRPTVPHRSRSDKPEDAANFESRCKRDSPKKPKLSDDSRRSSDHVNSNQLSSRSNNTGHPILERQLSSPTSRSNIKRSPAFRCDKIVKGRNVLIPNVGVVDRPKSVVDSRVKQFDLSSPSDVLSEQRVPRNGSQIEVQSEAEIKGRASLISSGNFFRPSKVPFDSDHRGPIEAKRNKVIHSKNTGKGNSVIPSSGGWLHNQKQKDAIRSGEEGSESEFTEQEGRHLKQHFSDVKLQKVNIDSKGLGLDKVKVFSCSSSPQQPAIRSWTHSPLSAVDNVIPRDVKGTPQPGLTDTLKAALTAPLPPGPPPKKPPRTFAHNSPSPSVPVSSEESCDGNSSAITKSAVNSPCHTSIAVKPVRSKTESQIMLKKLESALLSRTSSKDKNLNKSSDDTDDLSPCGSPPSTFSPQPVPVTPSHAARSGCLSSLHCATGPIKCSEESEDNIYTKKSVPLAFMPDPKRKSSLQDTASGTRQNLQGYLHKSHSVEHIYAEPFQFMGDGFQTCKSKNCEANFRLPPSREQSKQKFHAKRILSTSPDQLLRVRRPSPIDSNSEGLHYLCTPIQENSPVGELQMSSLPLRLSPPIMEEADHGVFKRPSRECLSLEVQPSNVQSPASKLVLKRSSAEKEKIAKDMADSNLNTTKIKFLMNQAFGSPLQCLPTASLLDSNSDSDSVVSTPDEGVSVAPFPGVPSIPIHVKSKEIIRPSCPPPEVPESASPSKECLQQLTAERRTYVRRVSSHVMGQRSLRQAPQSSTSNHLFECLLLVGLNLDPDRPKCKVPYVKSKFPLEASVPPHIESLCFPDAAEWPPPLCDKSLNESFAGEEQSYSLVVTSDTGDRKYGYCRRVQPEGAPICLPLAYCILTPHRASGFFFKVLAELESRHGEPEIQQTEFIQHLYECAFPNPGQGVRVSSSTQQMSVGCTGTSSSSSSSSGASGSGSGSRGNIVLRRPYDTRLEDCDLTRLFNSLQIHVFLQVFSSLLLERKVLLLSKSISKLSACVDALQSILFPFVWQHTFIPVLPTNMIDICQAPTPFIIGVLKGRHVVIPPVSIDHGIVVDVDNSLILQSQQDETTILPVGINRSLKIALQLAQNSTKPNHPSRNVLVSEAFLRTFVEVCGHYQTHIVTQQDGKKLFERESFIKAVRSRSIQMFLEWFTETSMFSAFIESRLEKPEETKGMFEQRVSEHLEEREKNTSLYLKNYKGLNKKVKTLGDRFKDWAPFS